jgi:ribosomal protein S27E
MKVDLHLLTNHTNKRQRWVGQLEEYFEALVVNYTTSSERDLLLLAQPRQWWLQVRRNRYPILFKIATDFLSISCTSCDCERCFSSARRTITCDRNSLSGATIEAIQLQKNWLRRSVVKSSLKDLQKHIQNVDKKLEVSTSSSLICASQSQSGASYGS